jgi:hypothetical protein
MEPVTFFTFHNKTAFLPLKFVYPECTVLLEHVPQAYPLMCMKQPNCPANRNCGELIAKRVHYLFDKVVPTDVKLIIAYYKYRDRPESIRGVTFWRDMSEPDVKILNRSGFDKFLREGTKYQWVPTTEYLFLSPSNTIIPVETLLRGNTKS